MNSYQKEQAMPISGDAILRLSVADQKSLINVVFREGADRVTYGVHLDVVGLRR
jgi:hypothetical protein